MEVTGSTAGTGLVRLGQRTFSPTANTLAAGRRELRVREAITITDDLTDEVRSRCTVVVGDVLAFRAG
jgi:hypothetical protein